MVTQKWMTLTCLLAMATLLGCLPSPSADNSDNKPAVSTTPGVTAAEATPRETIGKTTQNVLPLKEAVDKGGVPADKKAGASNPLLASAAAYRNSVATIGSMAVDKAIQLRNAQSIREPKPLTYDVFMEEIIQVGRGDGIWLPMLPTIRNTHGMSRIRSLWSWTFPPEKRNGRSNADFVPCNSHGILKRFRARHACLLHASRGFGVDSEDSSDAGRRFGAFVGGLRLRF